MQVGFLQPQYLVYDNLRIRSITQFQDLHQVKTQQ